MVPMNMPAPMGLPPLNLSGGAGGAATAGGNNRTGGGGGLDGSNWSVSFGRETQKELGQAPARVAYRADPFGMPQTVAAATMQNGQQHASPTPWLLLGLVALLLFKRAK